MLVCSPLASRTELHLCSHGARAMLGLLRIDGGVCTPAGGSEQAGGASCCEQRTTGGGAWRRGRDPPNACCATRIATRGASCGWDVGGTEAGHSPERNLCAALEPDDSRTLRPSALVECPNKGLVVSTGKTWDL
jgi:hypothetical protein